MVKRILLAVLLLLVVIASIILVRTFTFNSRQTAVETLAAPPVSDQSLERFSKAIRIQTVSHGDPAKFDSVQFLGFRRFLEENYPLVHQKLSREVVKDYTLLFTWTGKNEKLNPFILMGHQDVVPVEEETLNIWTGDPFSGAVRDGFIWGRGSADDKINVISIMEVVEKLLKENFQPERTILLAFGHDEELGGEGAKAIVQLLQQRNIRAQLVIDEGGIITRTKVPGMTRPVALLGTAEKGIMSLELRVEKSGGHAAMPEKETAIDILTKAIARLRENEFEPSFGSPTDGFIESVGPELPFTQRMAFANMWAFEPVVTSIYEQSAAGNALIRTTIAPTILQSGIKDNVVPTVARAVVNFRLLPGDSSAVIAERVRKMIDDDRVIINQSTWRREATPVTSTESFAYKKIEQVARMTSDSLVTAPFLMIAATDSRYYQPISDGIIKFTPMYDPIGFHGIDERVSIESFQTVMWFFEQLIRNTEN